MKYEEIMDRVEVTPEMRQRILNNLKQDQKKEKKRPVLRQLMSLAACLAILLCCWYAWKPRQQTQVENPGAQGASQIENVASLEALSQKTGVPMKELTGLPFDVEATQYVSYWEELAEIQYFGQTDSLCYRKSHGTGDNSGDYNVYSQVKTLDVSGCAVTLKGGAEGYSLAAWTDGTYAYSISASKPLTEETFRGLLEANF